MSRPKLLDLFACEGGASVGYHRAGFDVYAVDLDPNRLKRNPNAWRLGDALDALVQLTAGGFLPFLTRDGFRSMRLRDFDAIHASPPCQGYTRGNAGKVTAWPKLIPEVRALLEATGLPYVIENVEDAGPELIDPILLCGRMFDLRAYDTDGALLVLDRHRLFESSIPLVAPEHPEHVEGRGEFVAGVYGGGRRAPTMLRITSPDSLMTAMRRTLPANWKRKGIPAGWTVDEVTPHPSEDRFAARIERSGGYVPRSVRVQGELLGIDWMTARGLQESVPPIYATHVGAQLLAHIESEKAA